MAPWLCAVPYQTENAAMHAPVVHPFHDMLPTDRPNFVYCTHTKRKQNKQTNKGEGNSQPPHDESPTFQQKKKKRAAEDANALSHDNALSVGNPSLLGLLGFFGLLLRPESPLAPAPTLALGL